MYIETSTTDNKNIAFEQKDNLSYERILFIFIFFKWE